VYDGTTWEVYTQVGVGSFDGNYPQNIQSANYTLLPSDAGKQIFHPASDTFSRTYTIPANNSVPFPLGTVVLFTVENGSQPVAVNINSDTLVFGDGTTGTLRVFQNNTLVCIKVTATKWMANYLYQTGVPAGNAVAVTHANTPFITVYSFLSSGAFGRKYDNPSVLPASSVASVSFNPAGNVIAVSIQTAPFIIAYSWDTYAGFGTKYPDPAVPPTITTVMRGGCPFSPAGDAIVIPAISSPFVSAYRWNNATGFGTKYTDPASNMLSQANGVSFNSAGTVIAFTLNSTPFIAVYPWDTSTGFGTRYANPATLPTGFGNKVDFSPAGDAVAICHGNTPFISAYPWDNATGFGTKYTDPAVLPATQGETINFSRAGDALIVATTSGINAYAWSASGFGTKYTDPAGAVASVQAGAINAAGNQVFFGHFVTPFISSYPWDSATGFGTKYNDPAVLPAGSVRGLAINSLL
jgi:WD40 repeat protein